MALVLLSLALSLLAVSAWGLMATHRLQRSLRRVRVEADRVAAGGEPPAAN